MVARLGNVLYWFASAVAVLALAGAAYSLAYGQRGGDVLAGLGAAFAVLVWLIGRACRYVLAGR